MSTFTGIIDLTAHTLSLYCSYTVVESFDTFWVMLESPGKLLGRTQPLPGNELFIKLHGNLLNQLHNFNYIDTPFSVAS